MLDSILSWLSGMGDSVNHPLVLLTLAAAAGIEYIIPVFPGDSVTLLGGVLVGAYQWNLAIVFFSVLSGSVLGSWITFAIGQKWQMRRKDQAAQHGRLSKLVEKFRKRGSWYLVLNRFMPGIRPLFFVAAGLAGMSTRRVLILSALSAAAWNAGLMAAGIAVGHNMDRLEGWLRTYSTIAWITILLVIAVYLLRMLLSRSRRSSLTDHNSDSDD